MWLPNKGRFCVINSYFMVAEIFLRLIVTAKSSGLPWISATVLKGRAMQVVYRESAESRIFVFLRILGPTQGGPGRFFQGKKNPHSGPSLYTTLSISLLQTEEHLTNEMCRKFNSDLRATSYNTWQSAAGVHQAL